MTTLLEQTLASVQSITPEHHAAIVAFCRRNHIHRLALFGSVLRQDFRPESDVDVLVEFAPDHTPGLGLIRMQDELSHLFHDHRVDLVTLKFLNSRIRERVQTEAQAIYSKERMS